MNKECADVPFIFLSALTTPMILTVGRNLGADDYVTNRLPFTIATSDVMASGQAGNHY